MDGSLRLQPQNYSHGWVEREPKAPQIRSCNGLSAPQQLRLPQAQATAPTSTAGGCSTQRCSAAGTATAQVNEGRNTECISAPAAKGSEASSAPGAGQHGPGTPQPSIKGVWKDVRLTSNPTSAVSQHGLPGSLSSKVWGEASLRARRDQDYSTPKRSSSSVPWRERLHW